MTTRLLAFAAILLSCTSLSFAETVGGPRFEQWTGLNVSASGDAATLTVPGTATWRHPDGKRGFYKHGFRVLSDGAANWYGSYGLRLSVAVGNDAPVDLAVSVIRATRTGLGEPVTARTVLAGGAGAHEVVLPWSAFDVAEARRDWLVHVKELRIEVRGDGGGTIRLGEVRVVQGAAVSLGADVRGKSTQPGEAVEYSVKVGNCTETRQSVALAFQRYGWESMDATVEPRTLTLEPGETRGCVVRVAVPSRIPPGGHERQVLRAIPNGDAARAAKLSFVTAATLPHPHILHTAACWDEVRAKVEQYAWARESQASIVEQARKWQVPEAAKPPHNDPDDTYGPFVFRTQVEQDVMAAGMAWQLTRDATYARKVAEFLRRLSDPETGYPSTFRACNQALVQEGHFFQHIAMGYDMILDAGVLDDADRAQIDATLRMFLETIDLANLGGPINNWNLSENCGALYSALATEDLASAERFFSGPSGVVDQLSKGTMDDGWWYECSISYNVWCASEFSQVALALQPWGIGFGEAWESPSYSRDVMLSTELSGGTSVGTGPEQAANRPFGMAAEVWGPMRRTHREITDLWNSLLPFLDYRGVMFGVNDSTEQFVVGSRREVGGVPFELAYYLFRDPAYAGLVKLGARRDLLYGVPELPKDTPERYRDSAFADNVGLAMLRSQTPDRPIREQIQAVLHYGTHGWAHGHYDRTNLLSLMRYGRSFYNPEMVWFGYEPFMYKFYVQTSESKNMVVADRKMQEATPGRRLLFHTGKLMQATAVETTARWSNPPYGGMVYDYVPVKTFEEKTWREGRHVPIPENPPAYGTLTGYTEPVLQRRAMVVTDDYVVLADYVKGGKPHTFESLFQMKGFQGLDAAAKTSLRHDAQWDPDPVKAAQFVTDCDWYSVEAPAVGRFEMKFGPGADNAGTRAECSEDGLLKLDVHSLWPRRQEIMVGATPEAHDVAKRLFYAVRGDGKVLAEGKFGAWILGQAEIDVPLEGVKRLELETRTELSKKPTVFWGNARVVTKDGREIPLGDLSPKFQNVVPDKEPGKDYLGGPIGIVGVEQASAVAGQPQDDGKPAVVRVDLAGRDAVRLKATLGGDYPLGDEAQRRKTYAVRAPGEATEARFLTVVEPYENKPVVKSAEALGPDRLRVTLADGRVQEISIANLEGDGSDIEVSIAETRNGVPVGEETTAEGN